MEYLVIGWQSACEIMFFSLIACKPLSIYVLCIVCVVYISTISKIILNWRKFREKKLSAIVKNKENRKGKISYPPPTKSL